jgi:CarD family transcriptional regulator
MYGAHGVCKITGVTELSFQGKAVEYYVLQSAKERGMSMYVPTQNKTLTAQMHKLLSEEEIYALIRSMPDGKTAWVENDAERREMYNRIITNGDRAELVRLIKMLYERREALQSVGKGKKLHADDERYMRSAMDVLHEELSHVLNITDEQVLPFILEQIEAGRKA